jgi:O-antigen/teichoic acid export membrane protein
MYILLLPVIYFYGIWGYIWYEFSLSLATYLGFYYYRPYKVKYKFSYPEFKDLVKIGLPMYFWNYLAAISRSVPRLILVLFGNQLLVGLFAPATSVNTAMLNLPMYINRYLFPKLSFMYGKEQNTELVFKYTVKTATILFVLMISIATIIALLIPYLFSSFFPKYIGSVLATQIILFSGVFYSINALVHNSLNSLKHFKPFKYIITFRVIYILLFSAFFYYFTSDLIISVALSSAVSEMLNMLNYFYFLRQVK